jgi:hypothetical protein
MDLFERPADAFRSKKWRGLSLNFFAAIRRGYAELFFERPAEMREVFEAGIQGDLRNVQGW